MDIEEDWELIDQPSTPIVSQSEWITTANVQEVVPGAMTPLSMSFLGNKCLGDCVPGYFKAMSK